MGRLPRVSIGLMMAVVLLVAADLATVRSMRQTGHTAIAIVTLPMINLLVLTHPRMRSDPVADYWRGFQAGGWMMVLLVGLLVMADTPKLFLPIFLLAESLTTDRRTRLAIEIAISILLFTTPQLLVAMHFGRRRERDRAAIERR